jgi:RNA polymerase sigma factor (sigma-70 family)
MNIVVKYMEANRGQLVSAITRWVADNDSAEDVFQDAVIAVLKADPDIEEERALAYAWVVCRRTAMHFNIEQSKRTEGCPEDQVDLTFVQLHQDSMEDCRDPVERLMDYQKHNKLPDKLEEIRNETHKKLMSLVLLEEVSIATAAMICGLNVNNARVIVHRLSSQLKL